MKKVMELFWMFFKIGLFTFGGGYAMIPQLKNIIIEQKKWMSESEMLEMIAIAESTPGPIAINMSTYIGYKQKKIFGSIFATLGVVLPSFIIIFLISLVFKKFMYNEYIAYAFVGIKCAIAFLIIKVGIELIFKLKKNFFHISILIIIIVLMIIFELFNIHFSSIYLIIIGGVLEIVITSLTLKSIQEDHL